MPKQYGACFDCVWWNSGNELRVKAKRGQCRRHAPVLIQNIVGCETFGPGTSWPITAACDGCGEYFDFADARFVIEPIKPRGKPRG